MEIIFLPPAIRDAAYWQKNGDKKTLKKISQLLTSIQIDYKHGIGHPEPLKGCLSGYWSRRINRKDRIIYRVVESREQILIYSIKGHYTEK